MQKTLMGGSYLRIMLALAFLVALCSIALGVWLLNRPVERQYRDAYLACVRDER